MVRTTSFGLSHLLPLSVFEANSNVFITTFNRENEETKLQILHAFSLDLFYAFCHMPREKKVAFFLLTCLYSNLHLAELLYDIEWSASNFIQVLVFRRLSNS